MLISTCLSKNQSVVVVSQCSLKYIKANNEFLGSKFDPQKETSFVMYLDANNLYYHAMSMPLPYGKFSWDPTPENWDSNKILNYPDEDERGFFAEVDLDYPQNLHDDHQDYSLAPDNEIPPNGKQRKLLLTLNPKRN